MPVEKKYLHDINLVNNRLLNPIINPLTTTQRVALAPLFTSADQGYLSYDTSLGGFYFWNGTSWQTFTGSSATWGGIGGTITAQTDLINYLASNYYPLASNPASYITAAAVSSTYVPLTRSITINGQTYDLSANRSWTVDGLPSQTGNNGKWLTTNGTTASWASLSSGGVSAVTASSPLSSSGGATPNITIQQASGSQAGYLSSTDWTTFNGKLSDAPSDGSTYGRNNGSWTTISGGGSVTTNNVLYVSKNGNDSTGTRNILTKPYLTIQAAITAASTGDMVYVYPGTYAESIILKNGVNIHLTDGAIIQNNAGSIVTDNAIAVTCVIDGYGEIINTSTSNFTYAINISNTDSNIIIRAKYVESNSSFGSALRITDGTLRYEVTKTYGKTGASNQAIYANGGTLYVKGELISDKDYTVLIGGATVYMNATVKALNIGAAGNSGIHVSGDGYLDFTGSSTSNKLFGLEQSGGSVYIHDATIESQSTVNAADGSAISYYGGQLLELDNVILKCAYASANSIETQGQTGREVRIYTSSYATNSYQTSPAINFTFGKQNLLVQGINVGHAALNTDSKVVVDQLAINTPSNGDIIKYNSSTSKAEWGSGKSISSVSTSTAAGSGINTDYIYLVTGASTITLPTAVGNTSSYTIKRTGVSTVVINTTSAQTIDGSATYSLLTQYNCIKVVSDGSNWFIVSTSP